METNFRPHQRGLFINRSRVSRNQAAALIMTVFVLSILTILIIGFLSTMLVERRAAVAYSETQRAKLIAQGAVSHAIDILRTNIPEPARIGDGPGTAAGINWAVNPGRLTILTGDGTNPQYIPLHTGEVTAPPSDPTAPKDAESFDLNRPLPGQTTPVITGNVTSTGSGSTSSTQPVMRVKWANLQKDPTQPAGVTNPLSGRYAFWMDDECSKLNFNVAVGKPPANAGTQFGDQLQQGHLTPLFNLGDAVTNASGSGTRSWALGRPQSINLDVLFDTPSQLNSNQLLDYTFLHGFARYPEAIKNFVSVPSADTWFDQQKFNLTFYSRSPEFNTFGRSRLFTSYVPISLEASPSYQHPFIFDPGQVYDGNTNEVLNLNSLLGYFGFTDSVTNDDGGEVDGGNIVNRAQLNMLVAYLQRTWPGFQSSFANKYGINECYQIALNMLLQARLATTSVRTDLTGFSIDWGFRTTSVNYDPANLEYSGMTPERFYWRVGPSNTLMLPQTPGPHVTEVRLFVQSVPATPDIYPKGSVAGLAGAKIPCYIQYYYETEYYMHPFGPVVDLQQFPIRVDYMDIAASGGGQTPNASTGFSQLFNAASWTAATSLDLLKTVPVANPSNPTDTSTPVPIGPTGAQWQGSAVPNRVVVRSPVRTIGQRAGVVPTINSATGDMSQWDPLVFDASKSTTASVKIRFRPGMGVLTAPARPRQMIPLGLTATDTLQASFPKISLVQYSQPQAISWQIADPRLSSNLTQWQMTGPGDPSTIGTPGQQNANEPDESSTQKSKYHFIARAPTGAVVTAPSGATYALDRPDEYNSQSRVTSPGYWSLIHTGMQGLPTAKSAQNPVPWRTLNFGSSANQASPPDWLLLDLLGATYPLVSDQWQINSTLPDSFSTISYMNSTAGQVNLNSRIYPQNDYFQPPPRTKPLQAVFQNLVSSSDSLVSDINSFQTNTQLFDYVGRLADVKSLANATGTQWQNESLLRNMAGCLTTRSNTFGVWGVSQVVQKIKKNQKYDQFEAGDQVVAEKRFYALVERYIWPGKDGVPGNGHVNPSSGLWDELATPTSNISATPGTTSTANTLFQLPGSPPLTQPAGGTTLNLNTNGSYPVFDGPEQIGMDKFTQAALGSVRYNPSTLENAYNPPQAVTKYRVVYFKYLDQ